MRLERISPNKIKYSITFEELTKKGFLQEELLKDTFVWDVLFDEMLDEASRIYELNDFGAVSIEIYSLTSRELVLILTMEEEESFQESSEQAELEETESDRILLYKFDDFEHIISLVNRVSELNLKHGRSSLFSLGESFYLMIDAAYGTCEGLEGLCAEYGDRASVTDAYLAEYGIKIIDKKAFPLIRFHF